jgi:hypothetical protein
MRRFFPHPWGWASAAPILCAIHCALTPLVVVMAPALAPGKTMEFALLGISIVVAAWAVSRGLRQHGNLRPVRPIALGRVAWGASLFHLFHPVPEEVTTILATLVVAGGLIWNARLHCGADAESPCTHHECETGTSAAGHAAAEPSALGGSPAAAVRSEAAASAIVG